MGIKLHPRKTRIVHEEKVFEFLGFKIERGTGSLKLSPEKISGKKGRNGLGLFERPIH
jgi:hypothetical protein